jgi:hypothetical protein
VQARWQPVPITDSTHQIKGACGRARSIIPAGETPVPARQVSHRIASIGQARKMGTVGLFNNHIVPSRSASHNLAQLDSIILFNLSLESVITDGLTIMSGLSNQMNIRIIDV